MQVFTAIDLFCGAGGVSLGLESAGFNVLLANDANAACCETYRQNFQNTPFLLQDVRGVSGADVMKSAGVRPGELDLLAGGPPCQGFSIIGSRAETDPRNSLAMEMVRLAKELQPRCVLLENVPGLATLGKGRLLSGIMDALEAAGFTVSCAELLAAQYGVPQMRWRMVLIGFRKDLKIQRGMGFPQPTHGRRGIGELVPNCTIPPEDLAGFVTAREAFADLPAVRAGELVEDYPGAPVTSYQTEARAGLTSELYNHYAPRLSEQNLKRIAALDAGQDWRDLPRELLPESMKRAKRKDHTRRFSRMTWEGIPRSIITRFRDPKSGEYTHPDQDRTISIREAARIQSFPDRIRFFGGYSDQYDQVGNAVPPLLAAAVGREIRHCLEGIATFKVRHAFLRRPALREQASLAFYAP